MKDIKYKFSVVDSLGRIWVRTITRIKAARMVQKLSIERHLTCHIEEITQ